MSDSRDGVFILYNVPRPSARGGESQWAESDAGVLGEVEAIAQGLGTLDIPFRRCGVRNLEDLSAELIIAPERTVFNLVESLDGETQDFNLVPGICRALGKGCTGSDTACLIRCLDKWQTKAALKAYGVPTPEGVVVPGTAAGLPELPAGPLIVKPLLTEGSEGITPDCVFDRAGVPLWNAVSRVHRQFRCPALVEQFIDGRELNISVLQGQDGTQLLPLAEIEFVGYGPDMPRIVDYKAKWMADSYEYRNTVLRIPAPLPESVADDVRGHVRRAWEAVGCRDYARVDIRLDQHLRPYVLEVNANPDVSLNAGFSEALVAAGISYAEFVRGLVRNALARLEQSQPAASIPPEAASPSTALLIRWSRVGDRDVILKLVARTGAFRQDEVAVAREVLDAALAAGQDGEYQSYTALAGERPVGWVCFGPTACTLGTFDIYWIAVAAAEQGRGIGKALLTHAEGLAARQGGRLAVIETSGRPAYESSRQFYLRVGYEEAARLPAFYAPDDDKVVYLKRLSL